MAGWHGFTTFYHTAVREAYPELGLEQSPGQSKGFDGGADRRHHLVSGRAEPVAAGLLAEGKSWTKKGPFQLGVLSKPLATLTVLGAATLYVIGVQPPNEDLLNYTCGLLVIMAVL